MIKTLYLRLVLTFLAVVVVSTSLAFPIAVVLYMNRLTYEVDAKLLNIGERIVAMSKEFQPVNLESLLAGSAELNDGYVLTLFDSSGSSKTFGKLEDGKKSVLIHPAEVQVVLQGETYKSLSVDSSQLKDPSKLRLGFPLTLAGKQYALFVTPQFSEKSIGMFKRIILSALIIVLIIGSILILIASRYIVNPIKKLTLATNRLARGNFNVNVQVKQKDELGMLAESFNHMASELKQLEQMRQDFVSNVSHEIQSPLTSIRGFSKALRQPDMNEESRNRYLEIIERESERLSRLSENLLKLASLESEHHPFHPSTFDLDEQLRRVVVFYEPQWSEKQLELELDLPRVKISADADQLSQVWVNLLGNAIKFTPAKGEIRLKLEPQTDRVRVIFQDNGIGIGKEDQERIFDRFFKADQARQRDAGGSGLGLAIVRKIVDMHQGSIEVHSELGKGTAIEVTLPILTHQSHK